MALGPSKRLQLPPYKLVTGTVGDGDYSSWSVNQFEAATWDGVPVVNRILQTPIYGHRGFYFAQELRLDPESEQTSPYSSRVFQQFGRGVEDGAVLRVPTILLVDGRMTASASTTPWLPQVVHQAAWDNIVDSNAALLEQYNVFAGTSASWESVGEPYIVSNLPSYGETADAFTHTNGTPDPLDGRDFDAGRFVGGNVLILEAVSVAIGDSIQQYAFKNPHPLLPLTTWPDIIASHQVSLAALAPRFSRFKKVVYFYWRDDNPPSADYAAAKDAVWDVHQSIVADAGGFIEARGPWETRSGEWDSSIYDQANTDIQAFFSW